MHPYPTNRVYGVDDRGRIGYTGVVAGGIPAQPKENKMNRVTENLPEQLPVAVYGSLRSGAGNSMLWRRLTGTNTRGLGTAEDVQLRFQHEGFPYAHSQTGSDAVVEVIEAASPEVWGELIRRLDRLESHPTFYRRTQRTVRFESGETITAWVYLIDHDPQVRRLTPVPGNDWATIDPFVNTNPPAAGCARCGARNLPIIGHAAECGR